MGEPMTPEAEAAIRARLAAAAPGPWLLATRGGEQAHDSVWPADLSAESRIAIIEHTDDHPGDARLIAHAPEDIATLLAEVERLRAEVAQLTPEPPTLPAARRFGGPRRAACYARGVAEERARAVAWLRESVAHVAPNGQRAAVLAAGTRLLAADALERGEHEVTRG